MEMNRLLLFLLIGAALMLLLVILAVRRRAKRLPRKRASGGGSLGWALLFLGSGRMPPSPPQSQIEQEAGERKNREIARDSRDWTDKPIEPT